MAASATLLTPEQAAEVLGISPRTAKKWALSGKLRAVRLGTGRTSRVRFPRAALEEFIRSLEVQD